jgi:hypothetical protein
LGYVILSGSTGPNGQQLALAAGDDGSITVQDASEVTLQMLWSLVYDIASGDFAMINEGSIESGTPGVLAVSDTSGSSSALTINSFLGGLPPGSTWDVAPGGSALAVRPAFDSSLNLRLQGGTQFEPGTSVIANDGWSGGEPFETWTFNEMGGEDYPWNYSFSPMCAPATLLTANPDDSGGQLTIEAPNGSDYTPGPTQLWGAEYHIDGITPLGAVFINEEVSMAMRTTPGGGAVFCADPADIDAWSAWTFGPGPDPNSSVVYSVGDPKLNLNVSGAGPYNPGNVVITYPWQGGAENEQWVAQFVPHQVT